MQDNHRTQADVPLDDPVREVRRMAPDIVAELDELGDSLRLAHHWLARLPLMVEEEFALSQSRLQALRAVAAGATRVQDVAEAMGASMSSASRGVDALVTDGLVDRRTDPDDRRATRLRVTPAGAERLEQVDAWRRELMTEVYRGLGPERSREVIRVLAEVGEHLRPLVERRRRGTVLT